MEHMKYIVTDPCYIIEDDVWSTLCDRADDLSNNDRGNLWCTAFDSVVTNELQRMTSPIAKAGQTGFGDWANSLTGPHVLQSEFCADSGMVCVCPLTDEIEAYLKNKYGEEYQTNFGCVAIFEASNNLTITLDESDSSWTIVKIRDNKSGETYVSQYNTFDDEEDDDYYNDEEEDY